jgi:hypothetical protein
MDDMAQYRQGDVLVVAVEGIPAGAVPVPRAGGEVVLAHGEATGHRHAITDPHAELFRALDAVYLCVAGADTVLEHPEHDPITLAPGEYRVIRQREYSPDAPRYVHD